MGPPRACACVCAPRAYCGTRARAKGEVPHPLGDSQFDEHAPGAPAPPISHLKVQHGEGTAREFLTRHEANSHGVVSSAGPEPENS